MNVEVEGRAVSVPMTLIAEEPHTSHRGLEAILQQWADRPSRSWTAVQGAGDDLAQYLVAFSNPEGRIELNLFEETDDDLYSLAVVDNSLGGSVLTWGRALGEPDPEVQKAVLCAMRKRAEGVGLPETWQALETLVLLALGDAL